MVPTLSGRILGPDLRRTKPTPARARFLESAGRSFVPLAPRRTFCPPPLKIPGTFQLELFTWSSIGTRRCRPRTPSPPAPGSPPRSPSAAPIETIALPLSGAHLRRPFQKLSSVSVQLPQTQLGQTKTTDSPEVADVFGEIFDQACDSHAQLSLPPAAASAHVTQASTKPPDPTGSADAASGDVDPQSSAPADVIDTCQKSITKRHSQWEL